MDTRFHGQLRIGLVMAAIALAVVAALLRLWFLSMGYLVIGALALAGVIYAFYAKSPCRLQCGHVLPGRLISRFVSCTPGPCSKAEIAIVWMAWLILLGLPHAWLGQDPALWFACGLLPSLLWSSYGALSVVPARMPIARSLHAVAGCRVAENRDNRSSSGAQIVGRSRDLDNTKRKEAKNGDHPVGESGTWGTGWLVGAHPL